MIKELQILVEVEKALKLMSCVNFSRSEELKSYQKKFNQNNRQKAFR